jgi:hypothetical protein
VSHADCPRRWNRLIASKLERLERRALLSATPQGPEFHVNQFTTGTQNNSAVAMDNLGNFVVVWQSNGQDGNSDGIYARRYNAGGVAQGDEFRVNQFTTGSQQTPTVAMDNDGDFVVAWNSAAQDGAVGEIWARRFTSAGAPLGDEFHVNQITTGQQLTPAAAMDGAGNFVITWVTPTANLYDIYARRYNASGTALSEEFVVNVTFTGSQLNPAVAMDTDGDFVVAWQGPGTTTQPDSAVAVFFRRFDQAGMPATDEIKANQFSTGDQRAPAVGMDSTGNFVVAWESGVQDGAFYGIYARRYSAAGAPLANEFRVNTTTADQQRAPAVAVDDSGDFTIAWASRFQDGSNYGIYAQCYSAAGAPVGTEFRVNSFTTGTQFNAALAFDSDGDFIVTWQSDSQEPPTGGVGVFAQRYSTTPGGEAPVVSDFDFVWLDAPQRIEVVFNTDVMLSLGPDDLVLENLTTMTTIPTANIAVNYNTTTNTATFTFPGYAPTGALPDGDYDATLVAAGITNAGGTPMAADYTDEFFFLMADANRDRAVNLIDFNRLASNFGQSPRDFSQADFNYDGVVNLQDFNLLAGRFGTVLAAPAVTAAAQMSPPLGAPAQRNESDRMIDVVG